MSDLNFYQRHRKKILGSTLAIFVIGGLWFIFHKPSTPEYVTATAVRGDLYQTVEAVGTVVSDRDLKLQFPFGGIVDAVLVHESDRVKAGQILARLRAGTRGAAVASAQASVASAQAALRALQEGARPEEVTIAEAEVAAKRAQLEATTTALATAETSVDHSRQKLTALQTEAALNLSGNVAEAWGEVSKQLTAAENALSVVTDVLGTIIVNDALVRDNPAQYQDLQRNLSSARAAIAAVRAVPDGTRDYESAIAILQACESVLQSTGRTLDQTFAMLSSVPETSSFTSAVRETNKNKITAQRTMLQASIESVRSNETALQNASAVYDTRIVAERSSLAAAEGARDKAKTDVVSFEATLRSQAAQLQLKVAPARQTDLDATTARLRQAQAELARAAADYRDTLLTAPVDGLITKVNLKAGEYTPTGPAVAMLGSDPYRIEMFVSEIDIPKVKLSQTGSIELDAFRGTHFALRVSEIDPAATDKDGVSKYRVKLDFVDPNLELKIGMTGDGEIDTGFRKDVVSVPLRAVIARDDGSKIVRMLGSNNIVVERTIKTGMEGAGGDVEVSGVESGSVIIVLVKQ